MIALKHPVSGHSVRTDAESVAFWEAAGFRAVKERKVPAKKAAAKKSSSTNK